MNHYVMEPVVCTPASGWEKGPIENQVQHIRQWLFTPKLDFDDLDALNVWLSLRCNELGIRPHPAAWQVNAGIHREGDQKDRTIDAIFAVEQAELRPLGIGFDGYVPSHRYYVSTAGQRKRRCACIPLALFSITAIITRQGMLACPRGRYSVPAQYAGRHISLHAYAGRVVLLLSDVNIA